MNRDAFIASAVYSPDGQWIASSGTDRTVRVWRATDHKEVAILHGHTGGVIGVAFAADGRRLYSLSRKSRLVFSADNTVRVWDVDPRATLPVLSGHTTYVYPVAFSPDGRWIASGGWDGELRLWDATTGEPTANLTHPGIVWCLAFSQDGQSELSGSDDGRLRFWDVATARVRQEIPFPTGKFRSLLVSPDGQSVAATTLDERGNNCLSFCDFRSGKRLFSAEGRALAPVASTYRHQPPRASDQFRSNRRKPGASALRLIRGIAVNRLNQQSPS
jgi:WD40 repeat protein